VTTALLGFGPSVAAAQEPAAPAWELPTVWCTYEVVTLGIEQTCINVYGEGLYVDRVSGELEKVAKGLSPIEGAEVNLFGTLESGAPYNKIVVAPDSINFATAWFEPRADFKDGSQLCVRAKVGAVEWSPPTCVTIHA
jgi:hypothetical protein